MMSGRFSIWALAVGTLVLAACSGSGSHQFLPASGPITPQSVSPGLIKPAPMAQTAILPPSAMSAARTTQGAISALNYTLIPGSASAAAGAPDGSLWVLSNLPAGPDKYIWHYSGGSWTNINGLASKITVAPNGTLYAINSGGGAYSYSGGTWTAFGGGCADLTVASDGSLYVLSNAGASADHAIWHYSNGWTQSPGSGLHIAASWDTASYVIPGGTIAPGGLYILNSVGSIYYTSGNGTFVSIPGGASAIAPAATGGIFVLGFPLNPAGNQLYYFDLSTGAWNPQVGAGLSISAAGGRLYVVTAGGAIYWTTVAATSSPSISFLNSVGQGLINGTSSSAMVAGISGYNTPQNSSSATLPTGSISVQIGSSSTPLSAGRSIDAQSARRTVNETPDQRLLRDLPYGELTPAQLASQLQRVAPGTPVRRTMSFTPPPIGTVRTFNVVGGSISGGLSGNTPVDFTLQSVGAHGYIWMDNTFASTIIAYAGQLASSFDRTYVSDTANFGPAVYSSTSAGYQGNGPYATCTAAGVRDGGAAYAFLDPSTLDGKVNVLVVNSGNAALGTGVGGYFNSVNFYNQSVLNCIASPPISNQQPEILIAWNVNNSDNYELLEDTVRGMAHELQHFINYNDHVIINNLARSDDRWLNEGMSVLAQDFATSGNIDVDDALYRASNYLRAPEQFSLTGFRQTNSTASNYNCSACYGLSYLFARYMYDRFGASVTSNMEQGPTYGSASLLRVSGEPDMPTLLGEFGTALANSGTGASTDARYNFGTSGLNLRGTYNSPNGFRTITLTGPSALGILSPGTTTNVSNLPAGSFAFFSVAPIGTGGNAVKLLDTTLAPSPMIETGSIVQR